MSRSVVAVQGTGVQNQLEGVASKGNSAPTELTTLAFPSVVSATPNTYMEYYPNGEASRYEYYADSLGQLLREAQTLVRGRSLGVDPEQRPPDDVQSHIDRRDAAIRDRDNIPDKRRANRGIPAARRHSS